MRIEHGPAWCQSRDRLLFWLNTVLVGWFFIALSGLNLNPATSGLLLLALLCIWPSLNNLPQVWQQQRFWLLGLILYGLFMIGYRLLEGSTDLSSLDRPARFIAMALVMLYLLRFGFCGRYLWLAVMLGTLTGSALGLYEVFMTGSKRAGVGVYPITFGYLMTAMSLLCFFYARYETARYRRILLALSGLLGIFGAFSSGTRGVVVILAVVLLVVMWRSLRHNSDRWRWLSAAAGVLVIGLLLSYQLMPQAQRAIEQTRSELVSIRSGDLDTSFGSRLQMWSVALHHGLQQPLTGVGHDLERMRSLSQSYMASKGLNEAALKYHHFHNTYLEAFAKRGLPGLAVLLFLFWAAVWGMQTHYRYAVLMIMSVFVVGGLTEAVMNSGRLLYLLIVGVTLFRCLDHAHAQSTGATDARHR